MNEKDFLEFLHHFKGFMLEEDLPRVLWMRKVLSKFLRMDEEQIIQTIQTLSMIEDFKKPSCKEEFNRIIKNGGL